MRGLIAILTACATATGVSGQTPQCDPVATPETHRALLLDGQVLERSLGLGLAGATVVVESREGAEWRAIGTRTTAEVGSAGGAVGYTVRGRVIELEGDQGISGALVGLRRTGAHTFTAADGGFSLSFEDPDPDTLFIEHLGYRPVTVAVQPRADAVVSVSARLAPEPLGLEPIVVTAVRHPKLETRGFYERKQWGERLGLGTFMSLEELESMHATRSSSILDRIPAVSLVRFCSPSCRLLPKMASAVPKRGGNSVTGYFMSPCPANVYIDGVPARLFTFDSQNRLKVNAGIDELGIPAEVLAIEVYTRASQVPAEFGGPRRAAEPSRSGRSRAPRGSPRE